MCSRFNLADNTWMELRRLHTNLVIRSSMGSEGTTQELSDHMSLLHTLQVAAGRPEGADDDDDDEVDGATGTAPNTSAFGNIVGGDEAVQMLYGDGTTPARQHSIVTWFFEFVQAGGFTRAVLQHGPASCGKSVVFRALATLLRRSGFGVAITAPTGCAAFLINGCTLHSCLGLPVENNSNGFGGPTGPVLEHMRQFWRPVKVLLIDEISTASDRIFALVDQYLQLYKGKQGVLFGGLHMLLGGDLHQRGHHRRDDTCSLRSTVGTSFACASCTAIIGQPTREAAEASARWQADQRRYAALQDTHDSRASGVQGDTPRAEPSLW